MDRLSILSQYEYTYQENNEKYILTSGKYIGIEFVNRAPTIGEFCFDVTFNRIILCVNYGYYLWDNKINACHSSCVIPIIAKNEIIIDFLKTEVTGTAYTELRCILRKFYPDFLYLLKSPICEHCGKKIENSYSLNINGKIYCSNCYDYCEICGIPYVKDDTNECLCNMCRKRDFVLPYHKYYPKLEFLGKNKNNTVPYLGVELEVDEGGENNNKVRNLMNIMNKENKFFVYCTHDGSLNNGFEIITQPATLKYHLGLKENYEKAFNYLLKEGYLSHDTSTCGIHVHFNRDFYADNEELYVTRLLYLVDKFWNNIVKFSRRNQRRIDRYSKKVDMGIETYYKKSNKTNNHDYHYYAINLANSNTIEFRMFKGTLNVNTFIATLQFVNNCIICAKEKSTREIQSMSFEDLITGRACKNYWKTRKDRTNTEE